MSQQYDNTNRGVLFQNKKKKSEKHPDFEGTINVDGKELAISAWKKTSQKAGEFYSLSVKEPWVKETKAEDNQSAKQSEDDIPW